MFKFYVILAGHDLITDAGRDTNAGESPKLHDYEQNYKNWRSFRKHGFWRENSLKIPNGKRW